tara:strand:+ start:26028 stop:26885 length:858 start_codon:yes stop_codon:yes gene_type:complete
MADHLQEVSEDENFMQGDIIRRAVPIDNEEQFQWGFILNADCDIEQKKNSSLISWMEIIPADRFIERYWAKEQLDKLVQKQLGPICEQLNSLLKSKDASLRLLETADLLQWMQEEGADQIIDTIGVEDVKLRARITAINAALCSNGDSEGLSDLLKCAETFSQKREKILDEARRCLEQPGGFADYVFVPGIPGSKSEGFVVRLRDISGVPETEVFRSIAEIRIHDQPHAFYRVGRFSDGLRYQIVQKMAFLFSRIGSPRAFEEECRVAAQLLVDQKNSEVANNGV